MKDNIFSQTESASQFISGIADPIDRAFVQWTLNQAMLRPAISGDLPNDPFDLLYFAHLMLEISKKRNIAAIIFDGRAEELW